MNRLLTFRPRALAITGLAMCLVAAYPNLQGVHASDADEDESVGFVCSGSLALRITAVDGNAISPTKHVGLSNPPTPSTFSFSHVLDVRNDGTVAARTLVLNTASGWADNAALSRALSVGVATSGDNFTTVFTAPTDSLTYLETHPRLGVPLPRAIAPGATIRIRLTFSAVDLDNSVQSAVVRPSFTFVGSD